MKLHVTLKPGHPTGIYRRAGRVFSATAPSAIDTDELTRAEAKALRDDPWLSIEPMREDTPTDPNSKREKK